MDLKIAGKVALVSGASSGIGRAIAIALAQEGVRVALSGRRLDALTETQRLLQVGDQASLVVAADLTTLDAGPAIADKTFQHFGALHILVNCAAETVPTGTLDVTNELWQTLMNNMFFSMVRICQAAVPLMQKQKWGRIINISSSTVKDPSGAAAYDVAKAAILAYSKDLASEVAEHNILVNCVCPGTTLTPMWTGPGRIGEQVAKMVGIELEALLENIAQGIPLKRIGRPEEIASMVAFLASEHSSYITGSSIFIDGGGTRTPF